MTNYQTAKKQGLIKTVSRRDDYERAIRANGLHITSEEKTLGGLCCLVAEIETPRGTLRIFCGENGTARIDKPNGTHKWVYEKTAGQIGAMLKQTISFYK